MDFLELIAAAALGGLLTTGLVIFFMGKLVRGTVQKATDTLAADAKRDSMFDQMATERQRITAERLDAGNLPTTLEELDVAILRHQQRMAADQQHILADLMATTPEVAHAAGSQPQLFARDEILLFSWMPPLAPAQVKYYSDRVGMLGAVKRADKLVWVHRDLVKLLAESQPEPPEGEPGPD